MNIEKYSNLALRTMGKVSKFYTNLDDISDNLDEVHMILGIVSEWNELKDAIKKKDIINIGEELADKMWYIINWKILKNIYLEDLEEKIIDILSIYNKPLFFKKKVVKKELFKIAYNSSYATDIIKKRFAYRKDVENNNINYRIDNIITSIVKICIIYDIDLFTILQNNIDKLKARFPEKFELDLANNRNLKKERKELEK